MQVCRTYVVSCLDLETSFCRFQDKLQFGGIRESLSQGLELLTLKGMVGTLTPKAILGELENFRGHLMTFL